MLGSAPRLSRRRAELVALYQQASMSGVTWHISLIVPSNVTIWGDDSVDLRFIVLHGELRSQQGALDVFCNCLWPPFKDPNRFTPLTLNILTRQGYNGKVKTLQLLHL